MSEKTTVLKHLDVRVEITQDDVLKYINEAGIIDLAYVAKMCILHIDPEDFQRLRDFTKDPTDHRIIDILERAQKDIDAANTAALAK